MSKLLFHLFVWLTLAVVTSLLQGCVPLYVEKHSYKHLGNLKAINCHPTQHGIDKACYDPDGRWDNGTVVRPGEHYRGCFDPNNGTIHLPEEGCRLLAHELCHADNRSDKECDDI